MGNGLVKKKRMVLHGSVILPISKRGWLVRPMTPKRASDEEVQKKDRGGAYPWERKNT